MKFKEIKPGMAIHCPTEEDAKELLDHLVYLGFGIPSDLVDGEDDICYFVGGIGQNFAITSNTKMAYFQAGYKITEFFDLIEPDKPMTAKELLEKLRRIDDDSEMIDVFGCTLESLFDFQTDEEILDAIEKYGATKKKPKPVEVECGKLLYISVRDADSGRYQNYSEFEYWPDKQAESYETVKATFLSEVARETQKTARTSEYDICRVKEAES